MTYHYFNPDHEIAMAMNLSAYVPPRAARGMRTDLGYIPALVAEDGDYIIVEDVKYATEEYVRLPLAEYKKIHFVTLKEAAKELNKGANADVCIKPWGWNKSLCNTLKKAGMPDMLLPQSGWLEEVRLLSNRGLAVKLLAAINTGKDMTGESCVCTSEEQVHELLKRHKRIVVKAPWSCSGRGVRFMDETDTKAFSWIHNVIKQQGTVTVEVMYDKIQDFAMEFLAEDSGHIKYLGLSVFSTTGSAYTGNILATEEEKRKTLLQYVTDDVLHEAQTRIETHLSELIKGKYQGTLGVDMMIVRGSDGHPLLHPCVEINLRQTMGHVALALSKTGQHGIMHIDYNDGRYCLNIEDSNI